MRTSFVSYFSPKPRHTPFRNERAIVGAAQGDSGSAIPDVELIHPSVSNLDRETPSGNSTGILGVVGARLLCAVMTTVGRPRSTAAHWRVYAAWASGRWRMFVCLARRFRDGHGDRCGEVVLAGVEPERRVLDGQQRCVGDYS
jgi:hypothetical protein